MSKTRSSRHPATVGRKPASRQRKRIIKKHPHRPHGEAERIYARRLRVFDLRMLGMSFAAIGKKVGCSTKTAWDDVQCELEIRIEQLGEKVGSLRQQEIERCFHVISCLAPKLKRGDDKAANATLRASARIAMLLGLDAPTKIAPTDPTGEKPYEGLANLSAAELAAEARKLAEQIEQQAEPELEKRGDE